MALSHAKLIKKIPLTHDVFELHYNIGDQKTMIPGQFITFILPGVGGRAYSILELEGELIKLIIKRWSTEMGGRGGSILLCDAEVGENFNYVGPTGHFTLTSGDIPRCFLGTGTGFVPLYNQIQGSLQRGDSSEISLVFGVRTSEDLFYINELEELSNTYENFSYEIYLSKQECDFAQFGYVTEAVSDDVIQKFAEYYLCGTPAMIESCHEKLVSCGVEEKSIFFEKY